MPLFNDNSSLIVPAHPGFVPGKYYSSAIYSSNVTTGFSTGFVYYTYFFIASQATFNKVGFVSPSSFGASEFARLAIYKVVGGLPSSLVADLGEINFTSPGLKEISCSLTLVPGWYAIASSFSPNAISLNYVTTILSSLIGTVNPAVSTLSGLRGTLTYGAFPSSASLVAVTETSAVMIWLKAA